MKNKSFDLPPIREQLELYLQFLYNIREKAEHSLRGAVPGYLHISSSRGRPQYSRRYSREKEAAQMKEQYLSVSKDANLISSLAQQEYEIKLLRETEKQISAVEKILEKLPAAGLDNVFSSLSENRKKYVMPIYPDRETYIREWIDTSYTQKSIPDGRIAFLSEKGERVRSKSEKIIADKYLSLGIPYHYEQPLLLKAGYRQIVLHPDFTILNPRTLKQYYHEHLGMMDDPSYVGEFLRRLSLYQDNGIFLGDSLLITYETAAMPLAMDQVENMINHFLL